MNYLIIQSGMDPFMTKWYDHDNHYEQGMEVYDLRAMKYTKDGLRWHDIETDVL